MSYFFRHKCFFLMSCIKNLAINKLSLTLAVIITSERIIKNINARDQETSKFHFEFRTILIGERAADDTRATEWRLTPHSLYLCTYTATRLAGSL